MNKYEFVQELNAFLKGKVSEEELRDTISYYQDYIDSEIKKGRTEEEVLESLGKPRLLARTIAATRGETTASEEAYTDNSYSEEEMEGKKQKVYVNGKGYPLWLILTLIIVVLVLVFALVFHILVVLAPVILIGAAVLFLYRLFTGNGR